jgi:hypothetical protein
MITKEHLPKDFETLLQFPNGDIWLYSTKEIRTNKGFGTNEYKVYSALPDVIKCLRKIDGVKQSAEFTLRKGNAFDFIVQSFAVKPVLAILQDLGLRQTTLEF